MSSDGEDSSVENTPEPTYDRQEIIKTVTDFYQFLATLPYVEPDDVLIPPETGWPNITRENFAGLNKNDEVIELLKHLPYINMSGHQYVIAPNDTHPIDYRGEPFLEAVTIEDAGGFQPLGDVLFPEWVISLTYGSRDGTLLMLDTSDGTVTEYNVQDGNEDQKYDEDDPRSWRNECEGETMPLAALLADWKNKYYTLEWIGYTMNGWPEVAWANRGDDKYEDVREMRDIIWKYGWPDSFDRKTCKEALIAWDDSK